MSPPHFSPFPPREGGWGIGIMLETTMLNAIDADRLMRDVAYLSTLERHAGTEDEAAAFRYIADQCRAAGIEDVREYAIHEQITTTIWGTPTPDSIGRLPTIPSLGVTRNDGLRIVEAVKGGGVRATFSTVVQTEWRRVPIVVAHIPGAHSDDFAFAN